MTMVELSDYLPFYRKLSDEDRRRISRSVRSASYRAGDDVHTADECSGLVVVITGQLRVFSPKEDGREITLFRLFERDVCLFSASCMMRNIDFEVSVVAQEDSSVIIVPTDVFNAIAGHDIAVMKFMNDIMASRMSDMMWLMDQVLNRKLDGRLAALLVEESRLRGSLRLQLTHEELAGHLGSAREVISRTLGYLQREGEVELGRGYVEIKDEDALEARAEASLR